MALILLTVIGAVLGWLASIVVRTESRAGILRDVGVGVVGALVAGVIVNGGTILGGLSAIALLAGLVGAGVLLVAYELVRRRTVTG